MGKSAYSALRYIRFCGFDSLCVEKQNNAIVEKGIKDLIVS